MLRRSTPGSGHSFVRLWSCSVVVIACANRFPAIPPSESTPPGSDLRHTIRFYSTRFVRCAEERRTAAARATPHNRMKTPQSACSQRFCTTPSVDATTVQVRFSRRVATLWIFRAPPEASRLTPTSRPQRKPTRRRHRGSGSHATGSGTAAAPSLARAVRSWHCRSSTGANARVAKPVPGIASCSANAGTSTTSCPTPATCHDCVPAGRAESTCRPVMPTTLPRNVAAAQCSRHTMQSLHNAPTHNEKRVPMPKPAPKPACLKGPQTTPRLPRVIIPIGPQTRLGIEKHGLLHLMRIVAMAVLAQTAALRSSGSRGAQVSAQAANNAAGHRPHGARASHTTYPRTVTLPAREAHCSAGRLLQWTA